jgi:hypothetical protein
MKILPPISIEARRLLPSRWDVVAACWSSASSSCSPMRAASVVEPLNTLKTVPLSLSPWALPGYALGPPLEC